MDTILKSRSRRARTDARLSITHRVSRLLDGIAAAGQLIRNHSSVINGVLVHASVTMLINELEREQRKRADLPGPPKPVASSNR